MMTHRAALLPLLFSAFAFAGCMGTVESPEDENENDAAADSELSCEEGTYAGCIDEDGEMGTSYCGANGYGATRWLTCQPTDEKVCEVGEYGGYQSCQLADGTYGSRYCDGEELGENGQWRECEDLSQDEFGCSKYDNHCDTPLVLSFDGEAVQYSTEMAGSFDMTGLGMSRASDWPTARTPWLALDRNGNGAIDDAGELFGSATKLADGAFASNGFLALAPLDANGDGSIDARDPMFAQLLVWSDADANRASAAAELAPASGKLLSIDLAYTDQRRCDARGNCEIERAAFRFMDASGAERSGIVADVHLKAR